MVKRMNNYIVYKHTTPSQKVYIGITCQEPQKRWKYGKGYELCTAFNRAIQKYGWENIDHTILFEGLSKEEACELEQQLISKYKSTNPQYGYNLTSGGEHYEPSREMCLRMSESHKKSYSEHPEYRERISENQKGRKLSDEHKEKIRQSMLKYHEEHSEHRTVCGNSFRGKSRGEEFSKAVGKRMSKRVMCVETQKIYNSLKEAAACEGGSPSGISIMLNGRAKTCAGKTYIYAPTEDINDGSQE